MLRRDANEGSFEVFGGLDSRESGGESLGVFCSFFFVSFLDLPFFFRWGVVHELFEREFDGVFGALLARGVELGLRGEDAEGGIVRDLLYGLRFGPWVGVAGVCWLGFGQVDAGDLKAVKEKAGAPGVDVVSGDALQDLADGVLDGRAVFGQQQVKGGAATAALARAGDGFAGGVMVVAEIFSAQAWAGATVAVGEDVAALVLFWCFVSVVH
jgi:hypothetical protein